ncbi:MAG: GYD domain-containing protein [Caldilineaceae bacterium]|nr:GYD domain-containing protein [Caldilineaceae bacterium]
MPKYMLQGTYTIEGLRGVLKEGGSARKKAVEELISSMGGRLEVMYFTFGTDDFVIIYDGVDNITTAAGAMMTSASGAVKARTTVLLTPEEMDEAAKKTGTYRPPGQ